LYFLPALWAVQAAELHNLVDTAIVRREEVLAAVGLPGY
jgi:hypothetical protein